MQAYRIVCNAIWERTGSFPAAPSSRLAEDLKLDSLDTIQILMDVEQATGIKIPDATASRFITVGDITAFVERGQ